MSEPKNYYDPNDTRRFVDRYRQDVLVDERNALAAELEGSFAAEEVMRQEYAKLRDLKEALAAELESATDCDGCGEEFALEEEAHCLRCVSTLEARVQELGAENSYARGCITEHANFRTAAEARVQELEDALEYGRDVSKQSQAENKRLREALERIEGMAERPVCVCGIQTGTAAIKSCARVALKEKP